MVFEIFLLLWHPFFQGLAIVFSKKNMSHQVDSSFVQGRRTPLIVIGTLFVTLTFTNGERQKNRLSSDPPPLSPFSGKK